MQNNIKGAALLRNAKDFVLQEVLVTMYNSLVEVFGCQSVDSLLRILKY